MQSSSSQRGRRVLRGSLGVLTLAAITACGGGAGGDATPFSQSDAVAASQSDAAAAAAEAESPTATALATTDGTAAATGTLSCSNAFFGGDPAVGRGKACYIQTTAPTAPAPTTWTYLAWENQSFTLATAQTVRYGADTRWVTKVVSGAASCSNAFFGSDPAPGVGKQCFRGNDTPTASAASTSWTLVAYENQNFAVSGVQTVRYGVEPTWLTKTVGTAASTPTTSTPTATPTASTPVIPVAGTRSGLGINLDKPTYYQSDWPFINEFKRAGGWSTRCESWATPVTCANFATGASANNTLEQDKVLWDENGYAMRLPAADDPTVKYRQLSALLFQGNAGTHPAGRWTVLYDGDGTLEYNGAGKKVAAESKPGRDVVDVTNRPGEGMLIRLTRVNEANHLRNIRVIGPGGVCAAAPKTWVADASSCTAGTYKSLEELSATQTFHPAYIGDLSGFRVLRFMKWSSANTAKIVSWAQRPTPNRALWNTEEGVPYEAMFDLAAATGADPWVNVPPFIDDDFVRQLAQLAKRSLAPGANLYFEYGNEPWNQAPPYSVAGVMFEAKAKAKWPGATMSLGSQRLNWYAYRSVQLCRIVKQEFGAEASRVKCVADSQAANSAVSQTMLACELAKAELGNSCGRLLDVLAVAPYFGHYLNDSKFAAIVDAWPNDPDGGMDKIFRELTGRDAAGNLVTPPLYTTGGTTPKDGTLAEVKRWMVASKKVADAYGLPLVGYEGGQHLMTYRGGKTEAMFRAANRDPRMGAALKQMADDWKAAGGQTLTLFSYTQLAERGGAWGMKEHQRDDAAPKWQAVKALRDAGCWWTGCQ